MAPFLEYRLKPAFLLELMSTTIRHSVCVSMDQYWNLLFKVLVTCLGEVSNEFAEKIPKKSTDKGLDETVIQDAAFSVIRVNDFL